MKKLFLYSVLMLGCFIAKAQTPTYNQLYSIIKAKLPNMDLSNKIIAINVWSATNKQSREANKQFDKVFQSYENAKLKNGTKGVVIVSCNIDDVTTGSITSGKDGIVKLININKSEYAALSNVSVGTNLIYDNTFAKIYENVTSDKIFESFQILLTR